MVCCIIAIMATRLNCVFAMAHVAVQIPSHCRNEDHSCCDPEWAIPDEAGQEIKIQ